jgi:regulator of CtrA degradation
VKLAAQELTVATREFDLLPERFRELVSLSLRLHARVVHLDRLLAAATETPSARAASPVAIQQDLLKMAFGTGRPASALALRPLAG